MTTYTKEEIGLIQLNAAIELFYKKDYISALTLGGTAEEIFCALLKLYVKETGIPLQCAAEIDGGLFELFKDFLGIDNYKKHRYRLRNELKHHGKPHNENIITAHFEQDARTLIAGAIINYKFWKKEMPAGKLVQDFCRIEGLSVN